MFRNVSHIVLALLLLSATTGMAVSKHFCGDFLISTSLYTEAETCCDDGNCCQNETIFYQVDEDFVTPVFSQLPDVNDIDLFQETLNIFNVLFIPASASVSFLPVTGQPPPPPTTQTILSLEQTWLL